MNKVTRFQIAGRPASLLLSLLALLVPEVSRGQKFYPDIAPIIWENCSNCHRTGQAGPFPLLEYEDVRKRGRQIADVISDGYMPPWHATSNDLQFKDDRRLDPETKDLLTRWIEADMPMGDPSSAPEKPVFNDDWYGGQPDLVVSMPEPYEVYAEGRDIYRNFVLPLNNTETLYLKAIEIRPSSRPVVHHVLYFLDTSGAARSRDAKDPLPGFQGMGFTSGLTGIGGWAVGGTPVPLPEGMAFVLPPGSDIVLQTHFHPTGKIENEATTLGLYLSKESPTREFSGIQLPPRFGALAGVDIPPGEKDYRVYDSFEIPVNLEAFGISAHAHYLGKALWMKAIKPDGSELELLRIDDWDFNWQEGYTFREPIVLPAGTRVDAMVSWDNSADNPANPHNPPQRVRWGPFSYDEMGSVTLRVSPIDNEDISLLRERLSEHQTLAVADTMLKSSSRRSSERLNFFQKRILQFDRNENGIFDPDEKSELVDTIRKLKLRFGERLNNSF